MLKQTEAAAIDSHVAQVEAAMGVEVVAAPTRKADAYVGFSSSSSSSSGGFSGGGGSYGGGGASGSW